ncbi:MAG: fibrobacter succinogenes major paralogous domain-containing protein [Bacteroidia bacterium]|nr:fibrobacter succinogenes major paralogous domain-containing protein [Bacteroidia bacterium]
MRKHFLIVFLIILCFNLSYAQKIENVHFTQPNDSVFEIYYDINNAKPEQTFIVRVHYSTDGGKHYSDSLKNVSGDVGKGIKWGKKKKITWIVKREKEIIKDKIKFDVRTRISKTNETGTFKDIRDKKNYKWIKIGKQTWFAENLNYTTNNGSWCYENKKENCNKFGRLYDWNTAKIVCQKGWHLPKDEEWDILVNYLGGSEIAGANLKEAGTDHWLSQNTDITLESGFTALPGGYYLNGAFSNIGMNCYWWTSTEFDKINACYRFLLINDAQINRHIYYQKTYGFSVRCIKDK